MSENTISVGDINYADWVYDQEVIPEIKIFVKNSETEVDINFETASINHLNVKVYYYIENEEDVPDDGGYYWYGSESFPSIWDNN